MTKLTAFMLGGCIGVSVALLLLARPHTKQERPRTDLKSPPGDRGQLVDVVTQSGLSSNQAPNPVAGEERSDEPSLELLRLRGEVARLKNDLDESRKLQQTAERQFEQLLEQNRQMLGPSLLDQYAIEGIDTNTMPLVEPGATADEVVAELNRVNAKILTDETNFGQRYIHAEVYPTEAASGNVTIIGLQFWLENGALTSRRDLPGKHWE